LAFETVNRTIGPCVARVDRLREAVDRNPALREAGFAVVRKHERGREGVAAALAGIAIDPAIWSPGVKSPSRHRPLASDGAASSLPALHAIG
jgi:hypothetical protein